MDDHECTACHACGTPLVLARATCVASPDAHLHADTAECTTKLEHRLGTYVG